MQELQSSGKISNIDHYLKKFRLAELTFKHQIVYDTKERRERYLNDPVQGNKTQDLSFLGNLKDDHIAIM